jgi:tetratricopeptide (TPR) repeat protein
MMPLVPPVDTRVVTVRTLAREGRWEELCALFTPFPPSSELSGELLLIPGEAHLRTGNPTMARVWIPRALMVARERYDRIAERTLWNQLGAANFELGMLDEAEDAFVHALARARQEGDQLLVARASNNTGMIANIRGNRELATSHYHHAIAAYQRLGHLRGLSETYHNLALTAREQLNLDVADQYEAQAIDFAEQARDRRLLVMGEIGLAEDCLLRGDALLAERRSQRAAKQCAELGDAANEADALRITGAAQLLGGRALAAGQVLTRAVALAREHHAPLIEAEALLVRARYHVVMGNLQFAGSDARHALEIFERLRSTQSEAVRQWLQTLTGELASQRSD